ncbi:GPALPP motifs-containing protein 1-like [Lytechinus variegatus]|uniref:GPALPP motifs-containing protein 1-like n=1 Tax=Lytechinus variegatus TaxID=7654 RepID=UPI001BB2A8EB|nr:GPALPP motifs-containing protein 1-like [Lytechinus variegatus]
MTSYGPAMPPGLCSKAQMDEDDDDGDVVGPALPPHLLGKPKADDESDDDDGKEEIGPALPPHLLPAKTKQDESVENEFGVQLPPDYSRWNAFDVDASDNDFGESDDEITPSNAHDKQVEDDDDDAYGPALPPGYKKQEHTDDVDSTSDSHVRNYGPSLPPGLHSNRMPAEPSDSGHDDDEEEEDDDEEEEDDEMIGPMPLKPGSDGVYSLSAAEEFEKRAAAMKEKLENKDKPQQPKRETWMMELPGYSSNFGLGPRSFRKTARPEEKDRSEWTDTPADKARKEKERAEKRRMEEKAGRSRKDDAPEEISQRDKRLAEMVAKHNETKRGESLVDMHTKHRKRKLEEDKDKPVERRPFDRDLDLNVNQFDEAKRKLLIKKSAQLNDKFSHGKDKVYL